MSEWHTYEDLYDVYISPDEGVVEVRRHYDQSPTSDDVADLVAWAVGIGQRIGEAKATEQLETALSRIEDYMQLRNCRNLLAKWKREAGQ